MNSPPLVSCIIIFLNTEKFLAEAIESVFAQTYENWELLLIDDGSTDTSTKIAQEYAEKYPQKIRYLEHDGHQNKGTSASRNLGIKNAKGKYIAFLDADDIWLPHKLEKQIEILESQPEAGMVYGSLYYWYGWTGNPDDIQKDYIGEIWNFPSGTMLKSPEYLTLFVQEKILVPSPTCMVGRREVMEKVGGFEEDFRDLFDDQVFVAKMSLAAPIIVLREYFEKWRRHENSCTFISENITGEGYRMRETYLNWLEQYLLSLGVKDTELWQALRRQLFPYRYPGLFRLYEGVRNLKSQVKKILKFGVAQ